MNHSRASFEIIEKTLKLGDMIRTLPHFRPSSDTDDEISSSTMQFMLQHITFRSYEEGAQITAEDSLAEGLYVVIHGTVLASRFASTAPAPSRLDLTRLDLIWLGSARLGLI